MNLPSLLLDAVVMIICLSFLLGLALGWIVAWIAKAAGQKIEEEKNKGPYPG